eukprot:scaffold289584_cov31-Tisochrysis_lutea.AAC.2
MLLEVSSQTVAWLLLPEAFVPTSQCLHVRTDNGHRWLASPWADRQGPLSWGSSAMMNVPLRART